MSLCFYSTGIVCHPLLVKTVLLLTISAGTETVSAEEKIERAKQLIEKKRKEKEEEEKRVRVAFSNGASA
jgi:hypothetical protein